MSPDEKGRLQRGQNGGDRNKEFQKDAHTHFGEAQSNDQMKSHVRIMNILAVHLWNEIKHGKPCLK